MQWKKFGHWRGRKRNLKCVMCVRGRDSRQGIDDQEPSSGGCLHYVGLKNEYRCRSSSA